LRQSAAAYTVLAMLADTGERYLSTPLFADMTEEEQQIAGSTPTAQLKPPGC
jgi:cysteine synthase A